MDAPWLQIRQLLQHVAASYQETSGQPLLEGADQRDPAALAEALFRAPFVLLSHDKLVPGVEDPRFICAWLPAEEHVHEAGEGQAQEAMFCMHAR